MDLATHELKNTWKIIKKTEIAMCSNTGMLLHWEVYRIKGRIYFRLREPQTGQVPIKKGLQSCERIFYIPRQYKIQTATANTTREGRTVLIALSLTSSRYQRLKLHQSLSLCLHKAQRLRQVPPSFNLHRKALQIKSWSFCFHFY